MIIPTDAAYHILIVDDCTEDRAAYKRYLSRSQSPTYECSEAETIEEEPINPSKGQHGAIIRRIQQALLFELSVVTRPAYPQAQVEARCWTPGAPLVKPVTGHWRRWRL